MQTKLTQAFVDKATAAPGAERTVFWDKSLPGFGLVVTSAGHKSFVCQYRANGQSRRLTIKGVLALDEARKQAKIQLGKVAKGEDPLGERRRAEAANTNTLKAICDEYLKREGKKLRTTDWREAALKRLVYPKLGLHQIGEIKRSDIVRLLDSIEDHNGPVMADRTLAVIRRVMTWHASRSDDFRSPIVRGMARTKPKERERDRILTDDELRAIWSAAEADRGPFGPFVQFILLTAARRSEASEMTWHEIEGADWTLPAERNKTKADLVRPLSDAAVAILNRLPRFQSGMIFTTDGKTPVSGFSKFKRAIDKASGVTGWTLHDLRRTSRSLMSRAGVPSDHAERCLGHVIGGVRGTYDRHVYRDEMSRAYAALAAQLMRILRPVENVVQMRTTR